MISAPAFDNKQVSGRTTSLRKQSHVLKGIVGSFVVCVVKNDGVYEVTDSRMRMNLMNTTMKLTMITHCCVSLGQRQRKMTYVQLEPSEGTGRTSPGGELTAECLVVPGRVVSSTHSSGPQSEEQSKVMQRHASI